MCYLKRGFARYKELLHRKVLGITNGFLYPSNSKIYEKEPQYNETLGCKEHILSVSWPFVISTGSTVSRFFFIYFTITGIRKIVRYIEVFVMSRFVISRFHCNLSIKHMLPHNTTWFSHKILYKFCFQFFKGTIVTPKLLEKLKVVLAQNLVEKTDCIKGNVNHI